MVLESEQGDLAVLVPSHRPSLIPEIREICGTDLMLERNNLGWLSNCPVRHYFYPIHLSHAFLFTPTLASVLYLLLLRFLGRDYAGVFRLAVSC
eukprot:5287674-Prorocentrum_lima.AAC.1